MRLHCAIGAVEFVDYNMESTNSFAMNLFTAGSLYIRPL